MYRLTLSWRRLIVSTPVRQLIVLGCSNTIRLVRNYFTVLLIPKKKFIASGSSTDDLYVRNDWFAKSSKDIRLQNSLHGLGTCLPEQMEQRKYFLYSFAALSLFSWRSHTRSNDVERSNGGYSESFFRF